MNILNLSFTLLEIGRIEKWVHGGTFHRNIISFDKLIIIVTFVRPEWLYDSLPFYFDYLISSFIFLSYQRKNSNFYYFYYFYFFLFINSCNRINPFYKSLRTNLFHSFIADNNFSFFCFYIKTKY